MEIRRQPATARRSNPAGLFCKTSFMGTAAPGCLRIVCGSFCSTMAGWTSGPGDGAHVACAASNITYLALHRRGCPPLLQRGLFLEWVTFACASASGDGFSRGSVQEGYPWTARPSLAPSLGSF